MVKTLRSFLQLLEKEHQNEIVRIKEEFDSKYEIQACVNKLEKMGKYPVLIFENVKGYGFPLVTNVHATRERLAIALETTKDKLMQEYMKRENDLIKPKEVGDAPVKDVVLTGDKVDVTNFPVPWHFEQDAGPYVASGVLIAKDPDTGIRNASLHRLQVKGKDKFGVSLHTRRHLWDYQRRAEEKGKPLEVAIAIGNHPATYLGGVWMGKIDTDEYEVIGGFMGEPLEIAKCETINMEVPAHSEIVFEGEFLPNVREPEGPFAEFTGYVSRRSTNHVIKVKGITHRKDAIYQDIACGFSSEHSLLGAVPREPNVYEAVRSLVPSVKAVCYPTSGTCRFHCYISIKKTAEGQGKNAIFSALGADHYLKLVAVVDDDIDVFNESEVLWAIATRMQAGDRMFIVPKRASTILDPSSVDAMSDVVGIDATIPLKDWIAERPTIPKHVYDAINSKLHEIL